MDTFVAFFRGINVGGKNRMDMKSMKDLLSKLGLLSIQTYIQSGNAVFQYPENNVKHLPEEICLAIRQQFGFSSQVLIFSKFEMQKMIEENPFSRIFTDLSHVHFNFLFSKPDQPDITKLESLKIENEQFFLLDRVFYLYAPMGIGKSKLAANIEKYLGVSITSRNMRTVQKINEIASLY